MPRQTATRRSLFLSLLAVTLVAPLSRPDAAEPDQPAPQAVVESGQPDPDPAAGRGYEWAPVTFWLLPHVGTSGLSDSTRLRTNVSLSLGASAYARLDGIDLGVGASWVTESMRGAQVTVGFNVVGADAVGTQVSVGANVTARSVTGAQVATGVNVVGTDLRGAQIAAGVNVVNGRVAGLQVTSGLNYGAAIAGAQVGIVNVGGEVTGLQIGLVNIGRTVKGVQIGLVNLADDSTAPIGLLNLIRDGQHHLVAWGSDSAPVNVGVKLGGRHVYSMLAAGFETSNGKRRWLAGLGLGGHLPLDERFYLEADVLTWHINEDQLWTITTNSLHSLRVVAGYSVGRHFSLFAGPTLNLLATDLSGSVIGLIRGVRLSSESARTTLALWPGFVVGLQI